MSPPPVLQHAALVEQQHSLEHHAAFSDDALGLFNVQYVHLDVQEASTLTFIAAVGVGLCARGPLLALRLFLFFLDLSLLQGRGEVQPSARIKR